MDMSRVSACSYPLRDRPWQQALAVIADAGFERVDLLGRLPHFSLDPSEMNPRDLGQAASDLGLEIANLGTYVGKGFASESESEQRHELDQTKQAIDLAAYLGARSIRVSAGSDDAAYIDRIAPWFRQSAEYAAANNIYMGFETHGGGISGSIERSLELCEKVGSPYFGILFDPCNVMHHSVDYRMALWAMRDHIAHVHFKDAVVTEHGFALTMLGKGQIDFGWIIKMLDKIGYQGHIAIEYEIEEPTPEIGLPLWHRAIQVY